MRADAEQVRFSAIGMMSSRTKHSLGLTFASKLSVTIKKDLNLSQADVANSNIVSLSATSEFLVLVVDEPVMSNQDTGS